jgi:hypothetical protein
MGLPARTFNGRAKKEEVGKWEGNGSPVSAQTDPHVECAKLRTRRFSSLLRKRNLDAERVLETPFPGPLAAL